MIKNNDIKYYLNEGINSILSNRLISFISIVTISISMFILSFFISLSLNANYVFNNLKNQIEISAYLNDDLSKDDIENIKKTLLNNSNISDVTFINKEDSFDNLKARLKLENTNIINDLENPLPDSFIIKVNDSTILSETVDYINSINGIERATYGENMVNNIFSISKMIHFITFFVIFILFMSTIFIISNITKISVYTRKTEVEIMKYIGAKDSLIIYPFIVEGIIIGFLGSFISILLFRICYAIILNKFYELITFINLIPAFPFLSILSVFIILIGIFIGSLGSYLSVKKYINV